MAVDYTYVYRLQIFTRLREIKKSPNEELQFRQASNKGITITREMYETCKNMKNTQSEILVIGFNRRNKFVCIEVSFLYLYCWKYEIRLKICSVITQKDITWK